MTRTVTVTAVGFLVCVAVLALAIVVIRALRGIRVRRRAALAAGPRRQVLAFLADSEGSNADALVALSPMAWRAVEPAAIALLGKIRGEARNALASVFERRGAVDDARRELVARSPVRRARAAEALGNLGRADAVPALCTLLRDDNPEVRVVAARALGRIGAPDAAEPLLNALASPTPVPPQPVAHALIRIGPDAGPAVIAALAHPEPLVRVTALDVLGLLGASGITAPVADIVADDPVLEVRVAAAGTLGRVGLRSAIAPLAAALATDQPAALRVAAARALGQLGAAAAVKPLVTSLDDPRYRVAHEAAHALRRLGPAGLAALRRVAAQAGIPATRADAAGVPAIGGDTVGGAVGDTVGDTVGGAVGDAAGAAAHAREALAMAGIGPQVATPGARPPAQTLAEAA